MENNLDGIIGLLERTIAMGIIAFYIIPKQFAEVLRPKDWLTGLRWQILAMLVLIITASVPGHVYQGLRLMGVQSELLRSVASITTNLSFLVFAIVLAMIWNYKRKD